MDRGDERGRDRPRACPRGAYALVSIDESGGSPRPLVGADVRRFIGQRREQGKRRTCLAPAGQHRFVAEGESLIAGDGDANALALRMFKFLTDLTPEVATVYVGRAVSPTQVDELTASVARAYPDLEIETVSGGQELYDYIISVE